MCGQDPANPNHGRGVRPHPLAVAPGESRWRLAWAPLEPPLGADAEELLAYHRLNGTHVVLASARAQATCRSHLAEGVLAAGVENGIRQFVILGAGLDSFAYRSALADRVVTFEVDHPASQETKRRRLSAADIGTPHRVTFVPVDFEVDPLMSRLASAGFDPGLPAIVTWLGVSMYLTRDGIAATIGELGSLAPGSELLMDYMVPSDLRDDAEAVRRFRPG